MRARWSVTGLTSTLPIASDNIRYRFWPDQHDWLVIPKYIICSNACKFVTTTLVYVGEKWYHSPTPRTRRNYYVFSKMATCSKWIGWSTSNRLCCTWSDITSYTWTGRRWTDNTDLTLWRKCSSTIMCMCKSVCGVSQVCSTQLLFKAVTFVYILGNRACCVLQRMVDIEEDF